MSYRLNGEKGKNMTNAEYLAIIENPKATFSFTQVYLMLQEIRNDAVEELENVKDFSKMRWLCGDINGLEVAMSLMEHIERK